MVAQIRQRWLFGPRLVGTAVLAAVVAACSQTGSATNAPSTAASQPATNQSAATTQVMGKGTFHDVDGMASGDVQLVVRPDSVYEVVLESFKVNSIAHTNLVLVSNADVTTTADIDKAKLLDLGPLKATEGMQDFVIPAEMASSVMEGYHAAVIWDTEMAHAIAAAALN
jgi:hypothetical protein